MHVVLVNDSSLSGSLKPQTVSLMPFACVGMVGRTPMIQKTVTLFTCFHIRSGFGVQLCRDSWIRYACMRCLVLQSRQPNTQATGSCHTHHLEVWTWKVCCQHTVWSVSWPDNLCQARRNFLLVSHADCVASCLALMPHGRVVESVDYGASMLAWRTPLPALLTSPRLSANFIQWPRAWQYVTILDMYRL